MHPTHLSLGSGKQEMLAIDWTIVHKTIGRMNLEDENSRSRARQGSQPCWLVGDTSDRASSSENHSQDVQMWSVFWRQSAKRGHSVMFAGKTFYPDHLPLPCS